MTGRKAVFAAFISGLTTVFFLSQAKGNAAHVPADMRAAVGGVSALDELKNAGRSGDIPVPGSVGMITEKSGNAGSGLLTVNCTNITTPSPTHIRASAVSPDFRKILGNARVILFNDEHGLASIKKTLIRHLPALKAAGVTHLAMEFLPSAVKTDGAGAEELRALLLRSGNWSMEPFVELMLGAEKEGINIRGINTNGSEDVSQAIASARDSMYALDHYMAAQILKILREEPGARVMVFAGLAHVNPLYNNDSPAGNKRIPGDLIYSGLDKNDLRAILIATRDTTTVERFPKGLSFLGRWKELYVPMPLGIQPACNPKVHAGSLLDGILYSKD